MTGRYSQRTGVVDTFLGRAMMPPSEVTVAEVLSQAGYRTAICGSISAAWRAAEIGLIRLSPSQ